MNITHQSIENLNQEYFKSQSSLVIEKVEHFNNKKQLKLMKRIE